VTALALPCHLYFAGFESSEFAPVALSQSSFRFWLSVAIVASLAIGVIGTVVPLRIGIRAFQKMEL
jgi:ABC-2 type transport system permease protein